MNSKAIEIIKHYESLHDGDLSVVGLQPKMCPARIWTVGWGHALRTSDGSRFLKDYPDKAEAHRQFPSMTEAEADALLAEDYAEVEAQVKGVVKRPLNENQLGALVSFTFNMGIGALQTSTLLKMLNNGDFIGAANQFPRWNKSLGVVLKGLVLRREAEKALFQVPVSVPVLSRRSADRKAESAHTSLSG